MDSKTVAVVGAGTMGHGIAQVASQAGHRVLLYDTTRAFADKGLARIGENLEAGVQKGKVRREDRDAHMTQCTREIARANSA